MQDSTEQNQPRTITDKEIVGLKYFDQLGEMLIPVAAASHFEVDRAVPIKMEVTPTAGGEHDERGVMDRMIQSNRTYVMDGGYARYGLFNGIVEAGTSFSTAVLSGASAEMRGREVAEFDDLPGSGYQPTLLVELADGADYGNASQEVFGHLIFVQRLTPAITPYHPSPARLLECTLDSWPRPVRPKCHPEQTSWIPVNQMGIDCLLPPETALLSADVGGHSYECR
jgi:hypothetical protein